jgi:hypothetical protein
VVRVCRWPTPGKYLESFAVATSDTSPTPPTVATVVGLDAIGVHAAASVASGPTAHSDVHRHGDALTRTLGKARGTDGDGVSAYRRARMRVRGMRARVERR